MGQMWRYRRMTVLMVLLGATMALAACAPFSGATPTAAPPSTATAPPLPTASATTAPTSTVPAATATAAPATALAPTVAATLAPTNTAGPPALIATAPAPTVSVPTMPPPTAIPPTPSATVPPPGAALPPTLVPVSPTALAGVGATDAQGRCAITLPTGFAAAGGGSFSGANGRAFITVTALDAGASDTLDDVALPFVSTFTATVGDYQQTAVARGEDNLRLDFTGRTVAPGRGTIFLRQFGGTVCALSFFLVQGGEVAYDQTVNALLASLRPAEAIGRARPRESIV